MLSSPQVKGNCVTEQRALFVGVLMNVRADLIRSVARLLQRSSACYRRGTV